MVRQGRVVQGRRLVYYGQGASQDDWAQHWKTYGHVANHDGKLHVGLERPLLRHLPSRGRILEAGCGLGQVVLTLRSLGYEIEGIEWSGETVEFIHSISPDTPVRVGDVTNIEVPEHHYSGYISLGVVEHREEGPEPFLREALRVLSDDGVALISVPYFNPMRRAKAKLGFYKSKVADDASFYQYAYIPAEFVAILESEGFRVVDRVPYSVIKGAKDEIPGVGLLLGILRRIARRGGGSGTVSSKGAGSDIPRHTGGTKAGRALDVVAERLPFTIFAHMMLFVCVKRDSS